jgi:hypothetical protein
MNQARSCGANRRRLALAVAVAGALTVTAAGTAGGLAARDRRVGTDPRARVAGRSGRAGPWGQRPEDGRYVANDGQPSPHPIVPRRAEGGSPLPDPEIPVPVLPGG